MIPDYQSLMRPALACLADGGIHTTREVVAKVADEFGLTDQERAELIPSGRQRTIDNRVGWAITYFVQAGLVTRPKRAHVTITSDGIALLKTHQRIDNKVLEQFESFRAFKSRTKKTKAERPDSTSLETQDVLTAEYTPLGLVEQAVSANRAAVEAEILQAAQLLNPYAFEELVIRLLRAMGYGKSGSLERTGASGDAGVDGIISQDPLGLDRIYVQAKRYAIENPVGRPAIQAFMGALAEKQGDRGVFITTSRFTADACRAAEKMNARIELIDGAKLAELMVAYGVGIQEEYSVSLYRIDEDYFDSL